LRDWPGAVVVNMLSADEPGATVFVDLLDNSCGD
jgi:hypothetical protein